MTPSVAELYLAYRHAKRSLFFERHGIGIFAFAAFEADLPARLRQLARKLRSGSWFDHLSIGRVSVVPKRMGPSTARDGVTRIAGARDRTSGELHVQPLLSPSPEFATVEVLFLHRFGALLEAPLGRGVLGHRLDLRRGRLSRVRNRLFRYWPKEYQRYRTAPLDNVRDALAKGKEVVLVSGDLAAYYHTVDPTFLTDSRFISRLRAQAGNRGLHWNAEFQAATASLLRAYVRYQAAAGRQLGVRLGIGLPIGALSSRPLGNLALERFDARIRSTPGLISYHRYVDDFAIVADSDPAAEAARDVLGRFVPLVPGPSAQNGAWDLDCSRFERPTSRFAIQPEKLRVYSLSGRAGSDFVRAVQRDFDKLVSDQRSFLDTSAMVSDGIKHVVRTGQSGSSPLRVLRDADRAKLERFALASCLRSLARISLLVSPNDARDQIRRSLEQIGGWIEQDGNWVEHVDADLKLLKLALMAEDWASVARILGRTDRLWNSSRGLRMQIGSLVFMGNHIPPSRQRTWDSLRSYLQMRRLEAFASAVRPRSLKVVPQLDQARFSIRVGARRMTLQRILSLAGALAAADLRARDREDDRWTRSSEGYDEAILRGDLAADPGLLRRLDTISTFASSCDSEGDVGWRIPPSRLFLCTRPPSYFDVSRRVLAPAERAGVAQADFDNVLELVNALRGTEYQHPAAQLISPAVVALPAPSRSVSFRTRRAPQNPRVILAELTTSDAVWKRLVGDLSSNGTKEASPTGYQLAKLFRLSGLLDKARAATRRVSPGNGRPPSLLVLPELAMPRRWMREVAKHVVGLGELALVTGLEYRKIANTDLVESQVLGIFPGPMHQAVVWPWTKRRPAADEGIGLAERGLSFPTPAAGQAVPRVVMDSVWGRLSVLICSELLETRRVADLLGRVELVLSPSWNKDTASYDHLIQSVGLQLHAIVAIANNGTYSDSRIWAPQRVPWQRNVCRLVARGNDDVVDADIPLRELREFRNDPSSKAWRPLPPDWP